MIIHDAKPAAAFSRLSASFFALAAIFALCSCDSAFKRTTAELPPLPAEPGLERIEFHSAILGKTMALYAYLPPGYSSEREWPVLYLFHGFGNNEIEWFEYHKLGEVADRLIALGLMKPTIIIAPRMDNSWGIDSGKPAMNGPSPKRALFSGPYESYFLKEVMYLAETRYRASKERSERSLGGISMGGFAALHIGFRHPELFARVGGHSPALRGPQIPDYFLYAKPRKTAEVDPIALARKKNLRGMSVFVDCGADDSLFAGCKELADVLSERKADVAFFSAPGAHNAAYWHPNLARYLRFYAGNQPE
ncbi:esterase family protein [Treponema zuelzerae]|uniref:Esterase family protein n=1 Tax=Teretinema zuelzerae TaxID=156 RepID=A0AAE3EH86_9SPIR|nr:alpha/beta hydrolase-fold protein [Teretinema zuelzerae]MCD1653618.1 esterase family protein [Teretinema zuelzerae]